MSVTPVPRDHEFVRHKDESGYILAVEKWGGCINVTAKLLLDYKMKAMKK